MWALSCSVGTDSAANASQGGFAHILTLANHPSSPEFNIHIPWALSCCSSLNQLIPRWDTNPHTLIHSHLWATVLVISYLKCFSYSWLKLLSIPTCSMEPFYNSSCWPQFYLYNADSPICTASNNLSIQMFKTHQWSILLFSCDWLSFHFRLHFLIYL